MLPSVMCLQGNLQVASVYAGSNCIQLKGPEIVAELNKFLRLLTLCMYFSKKPFPVFLESAGYSHDDVLFQKPKAAVCYSKEYAYFFSTQNLHNVDYVARTCIRSGHLCSA